MLKPVEPLICPHFVPSLCRVAVCTVFLWLIGCSLAHPDLGSQKVSSIRNSYVDASPPSHLARGIFEWHACQLPLGDADKFQELQISPLADFIWSHKTRDAHCRACMLKVMPRLSGDSAVRQISSAAARLFAPVSSTKSCGISSFARMCVCVCAHCNLLLPSHYDTILTIRNAN